MKALKIDNVEKTFGKIKVLKGIDLEIKPGQFLILVQLKLRLQEQGIQ